MQEEQAKSTPSVPDPSRWVDQHGDFLFRFALGRTGSPDSAEELVQETFLAGLQAAHTFHGLATERTWLTSILTNKIIDRFRRQRTPQLTAELSSPDEWIDRLYDEKGHWRRPPGNWGTDPAELLQRQEFWQGFEHCRQQLPERLRQVFSLRLLDQTPAPDICSALAITPSNLWTLLHRARLRVWRCLEQKGLGPLPGGAES